MANVRKLPKLCSKRKMLTEIFRGDDDVRPNINLTSPFKQLKFSPVSKTTDRILFINGGGKPHNLFQILFQFFMLSRMDNVSSCNFPFNHKLPRRFEYEA